MRLSDGQSIGYDVPIVASGAQLLPEETEGMTGPGWMENVFTFYDPAGRGRARPTRFAASRAGDWS